MNQDDRFYPTIEDDQFRGPRFFEATVLPRWFSSVGGYEKGDRLIIQKTNIPKFVVVRARFLEGKFRSICAPYEPDRIDLIALRELIGLQPRDEVIHE